MSRSTSNGILVVSPRTSGTTSHTLYLYPHNAIPPSPLQRHTVISSPPTSLAAAADISAFMGFKSRISSAGATSRGLKRRSLHSKRRRPCTSHNTRRRPTHIEGESGGASVSDKMEVLKNLIPSHDEEINTDQLFQQTADYIVLLKTQVLVLQKLIDFYGPQSPGNQSSVYYEDKK